MAGAELERLKNSFEKRRTEESPTANVAEVDGKEPAEQQQ